jgi:hypothetical protein
LIAEEKAVEIPKEQDALAPKLNKKQRAKLRAVKVGGGEKK